MCFFREIQYNNKMELISTKICKTSDIGVNDNLFGGTLLAWMDEAGGAFSAFKCCTPNMITLKIDEVLFKEPVKVKQHIKIYGKILGVGKSSLKILKATKIPSVRHRCFLSGSMRRARPFPLMKR